MDYSQGFHEGHRRSCRFSSHGFALWEKRRSGEISSLGEVVVIRDEGATQGPNVNMKVVQSMMDEAIQAFTKGGDGHL